MRNLLIPPPPPTPTPPRRARFSFKPHYFALNTNFSLGLFLAKIINNLENGLHRFWYDKSLLSPELPRYNCVVWCRVSPSTSSLGPESSPSSVTRILPPAAPKLSTKPTLSNRYPINPVLKEYDKLHLYCIYSIILLWRKFTCDKSASGMLINPGIVFTFTRQRWSSTTFSSYLALLVWRSNIWNIPHLPTSYSRNSGDPQNLLRHGRQKKIKMPPLRVPICMNYFFCGFQLLIFGSTVWRNTLPRQSTVIWKWKHLKNE